MKLDLEMLLKFEAAVDATIDKVIEVTGIDLDAIGWKLLSTTAGDHLVSALTGRRRFRFLDTSFPMQLKKHCTTP